MREIGGYFGIELNQLNNCLYPDAIKFNSGRSALLFLIERLNIKSIQMPYFNCPDVERAIVDKFPEIKIIKYHIDSNLEPLVIEDTNAMLYYVNYFGLKSDYIKENLNNCIIDNAQAFFTPACNSNYTFYSARKFFGVSDGAYLATPTPFEHTWDKYQPVHIPLHLLKRHAGTASDGYTDYLSAEKELSDSPILSMSHLSEYILGTIEYASIQKKRAKNFNVLHDALSPYNLLSSLIENSVRSNEFSPLCYPFQLAQAGSIRGELIRRKIYIPTYWNNINNLSEYEMSLSSNIIHLPIDQRYDSGDMMLLINEILRCVK